MRRRLLTPHPGLSTGIGYYLGGMVYDTDPPRWNNVNYSNGGFGDRREEKVRIQTGILFAKNAGKTGFCGGFLAPWFCYAWVNYRMRKKSEDTTTIRNP